jgi:hypothetical protein
MHRIRFRGDGTGSHRKIPRPLPFQANPVSFLSLMYYVGRRSLTEACRSLAQGLDVDEVLKGRGIYSTYDIDIEFSVQLYLGSMLETEAQPGIAEDLFRDSWLELRPYVLLSAQHSLGNCYPSIILFRSNEARFAGYKDMEDTTERHASNQVQVPREKDCLQAQKSVCCVCNLQEAQNQGAL